jgi:hypothetical protein
MIISQDSPSVGKQLNIHAMQFWTDLIMKSNSKPYINLEIFLDYVQTVFLPNLASRRRLDALAEEKAVFLTHNCLSHIANDMIAFLTEARVRVITFAPDTAHNSDPSSLWRHYVWCSQMAYKIGIAFRRRESDRWIQNEGVSRLQTNNSGI